VTKISQNVVNCKKIKSKFTIKQDICVRLTLVFWHLRVTKWRISYAYEMWWYLILLHVYCWGRWWKNFEHPSTFSEVMDRRMSYCLTGRTFKRFSSLHYEYGQKSSFIMQLYVDFRTKYIQIKIEFTKQIFKVLLI